jgi:SAM-dependent methyltransferase
VNQAPNLGFIADESIDFVFSHMVLQHLSRALQETFVREFMRILAPGGIAAFQVASEIQQVQRPARYRIAARVPRLVKTSLRRLAGRPVRSSAIQIEMHVLPEATVEAIVKKANATIVASPFTNSTDPDHNGAVRFFDRDTARRRFHVESGASPFLSRFYVVSRARSASGWPGRGCEVVACEVATRRSVRSAVAEVNPRRSDAPAQDPRIPPESLGRRSVVSSTSDFRCV